MFIIIAVIALLLFAYYALGYANKSIFETPSIAQITFFRDCLFLTLVPYLFYLASDRYLEHYILQSANYNAFIQAAIHAFIFILLLLIFYKIFYSLFSSRIKKIRVKIYQKKIYFYLKTLTLIFLFFIIYFTAKYDAGPLGLVKFNLIELNSLRAKLSQSSGFLSFIKIVIKQWIPMLSYLWFYFYLGKKDFRKSEKAFLLISFLMGLCASVWYFEKGVIVFYLFGFVGVYVFSGGKLNKKIVLLSTLGAFFLAGIMYILVYQDKIIDSKYLFDILVHRTFSQCVGSVMAVEYFTEHSPLGFSGVSNLLANISGEKFSSPYGVLIDYYVPQTMDESGAMSSFAVGEAFGLFGYFGVFISGIIAALYFAFFEASKHSKFTAAIFVPIYAIFFSHFILASTFYSFVWPVGLVYAITPFCLITILSSKHKA